MRVGVIQMTSTDDLGANLAAARELVAKAAAQGAELIAMPENFAFLRREGEPIPAACVQRRVDAASKGSAAGFEGEIIDTLRDLAKRHGTWIVGGTFPEAVEGAPGAKPTPHATPASPGHAAERVHNTCVVVSPDGAITAAYRKIHLFDVDLRAQGGRVFRESDSIAPGDEPVVADTPFGGIGLSVCYDLRFPELYRLLVARGARFLVVPSAFTVETGRDHWEVLLRSRAIENQAFVLAPAQVGRHAPDRRSYGRSLIVDPWGVVLARAPDRPAALVAECRFGDQDRIRTSLPVLTHRKL